MKKTLFNSIKVSIPKSNMFDLTHDVKMSGKMGTLMPCMQMDCVPGDRIRLGCDSLVRFAPLIAPVMHRMNVSVHYFFVPYRILWDGWEKFITNDPTAPQFPFLTVTDADTDAQKRLADYLGIPPVPAGQNPADISAMPYAAYQAIYSEYYRDQNLIAEVPYKLSNGDNNSNATELKMLRYRAWEHDYFTAALPFAQKGAAVDIPLGEVELKDPIPNGGKFVDVGSGIASASGDVELDASGNIVNSNAIPQDPLAYDPDGTLEVGSTTINDLRRAFRLQEFLEKMARGGSRYIEVIRSFFGVKSSDARLQRPEYITGVKQPIVVSEVLNTTGETSGLPQGNMAGHAVSVGQGNVGSYYCEEHGMIIGIMSIMPLPAYQQGIPRNYTKFDPLEFYWPTFAHIGEQEILNQEIYAYGSNPTDVFGYIPRYAEYKYIPNRVAGDFRTTLDYWHLGRIFNTQPLLGQEFIEVLPDDVDRIFAVNTTDDNLYIHILNKIQARRPMPVFGTPYL